MQGIPLETFNEVIDFIYWINSMLTSRYCKPSSKRARWHHFIIIICYYITINKYKLPFQQKWYEGGSSLLSVRRATSGDFIRFEVELSVSPKEEVYWILDYNIVEGLFPSWVNIILYISLDFDFSVVCWAEEAKGALLIMWCPSSVLIFVPTSIHSSICQSVTFIPI